MLRIITKAISAKTEQDILSGIYIKTMSDKLELQTTDNETGYICHIPAKIDEEGETVLVGKYLQDVVNKLPGEDVNIVFANNITKITSGTVNFTLLSMNPGEFPKILPIEHENQLTIKAETLNNLVRKTYFAVGDVEKRPIFSGCHLTIKDGEITMSATNTHRLAIKKEKIDTTLNDVEITIPAKVLTDICSINNEDDVTIAYNNHKISFSFGNVYMFAQLLIGEFPKVEEAIPSKFEITAQINTAAFKSAIERVDLISRTNKFNIIRMVFGDNKIEITSTNPEVGNAEEIVPAIIEGGEVNIAFNTQYMLDVLKNIDDSQIRCRLNSSIKPISIEEPSDDTFLYITTPVRTSH